MVVGNHEAVCFYIDVHDRAYVSSSSTDDDNCPMVFLEDADGPDDTLISFPSYPGFRVHCGGGGKTIAIALTKSTF